MAERLAAAGHRVYAPSYTGMGDRAHLLSRSITIDTFVEDLVQVIQTEELNDVILVGHSFGGIPITGVADRIPERLAHLVYFDAIVLQSGQNAFSVYPQADADARIAAASKATDGLAVPIPDPIPAAWGFKEGSADPPGSAPPDRASAGQLHHAAHAQASDRQRPAAHLHPLHPARAGRAGSLAQAGQVAAGLELGGPGRAARGAHHASGSVLGPAAGPVLRREGPAVRLDGAGLALRQAEGAMPSARWKARLKAACDW